MFFAANKQFSLLLCNAITQIQDTDHIDIMRKFLIIILAVFIPGIAIPQYNMDYGINLGASNYLGEIGGTGKKGDGVPRRSFIYDLKFKQTKFAGGGWIRYKFHPLISAKANLMYLRIAGADSLSDYPNRKGRNLSFRNDIFELSVQGEYNFLNIRDITRRGRVRIDLGAYAFAGIGIFYHNPKAFYQTRWVALQPLGTEGQGEIEVINKKGKKEILKSYKRIQPSIPIGFGMHVTIKRTWRFGFEVGYRKTFTDYLDDASTRYPKDPSIFDDGTEEGVKAKDLSNRTPADLYLVTNDGKTLTSEHYGSGALRGEPKHKDVFMYTVISAGYVVRGKGNFYRSQYRFRTGVKKRKRKTRAKF